MAHAFVAGLLALGTVGLSMVALADVSGSSEAERAKAQRTRVAALVSGPTDPTTDQLLEATMLADAAVRMAPRAPWGYAARNDIARRWGDTEMMDNNIADLKRVAPDHAETKRAIAGSAQGAPMTMVLAWTVLLAACLATLVHAGRRFIRERRVRDPSPQPPSPVTGLLIAGLLALGISASAGRAVAAPEAPAFPIDDNAPERNLPTEAQRNARPMEFAYFLQGLISKAEAATGRSDHLGAAKYYRALAAAVPERSTGYSKLCESLLLAGQVAEAATACRTALGKDGVTIADHTRFVQVLLAKPGTIAAADREDINAIIARFEADQGTRVVALHMQCELGNRLNDIPTLEKCTKGLTALAPDDPKTITFQWALALARGDGAEAERLVARARKAGMTMEGIRRMEEGTATLSGRWPRRLLGWPLLIGLVPIAGLTLLLARRRRPAAS